MNQRIAQFALVVDDYDDAIAFYTQKLHFDLIEDTRLSDVKRWVVIKPKGEGTCRILLARAANEEQRTRIGNQAGGRVFYSFLRMILREIIKICWIRRLKSFALPKQRNMVQSLSLRICMEIFGI